MKTFVLLVLVLVSSTVPFQGAFARGGANSGGGAAGIYFEGDMVFCTVFDSSEDMNKYVFCKKAQCTEEEMEQSCNDNRK